MHNSNRPFKVKQLDASSFSSRAAVLFTEMVRANQDQSGNGAQHSHFAALLQLATPTELAAGQQTIVAYVRAAAEGVFPMSDAQQRVVVTTLCAAARWRSVFLDKQAMQVWQCYLLQALYRCGRDDPTLHYLLSQTIAAIAGRTPASGYNDRMRHACEVLLGVAWWELAGDLFEQPDTVSATLYSLLVEQAKLSSNATLPVTLTS